MDLSGNTFESNNLKKTQHKTFFKPDRSDRCIDISFLSDLPSIKMHMVLWSFIFFVLLSKGRPPPNMRPVQHHIPMTAMPNHPYVILIWLLLLF